MVPMNPPTPWEMRKKGKVVKSHVYDVPGYMLKRGKTYWQMFDGHVSVTSKTAYRQLVGEE